MIDLSTELGRALVLGGTVALPPYPMPGRAAVFSDSDLRHWLQGFAAGAEVGIAQRGNRDDYYAVVEQAIQPSTKLIRVVKVDLVRAFFAHGADAGWKEGEWAEYPQEKEWQEGTLFVPEDAPVLTIAAFSQTAAESAEYCPPTCERGCDGYVKWTVRGDSRYSKGKSDDCGRT